MKCLLVYHHIMQIISNKIYKFKFIANMFNREELFMNIEKAPLKIPSYISADAASLLKSVILKFYQYFLNYF